VKHPIRSQLKPAQRQIAGQNLVRDPFRRETLASMKHFLLGTLVAILAAFGVTYWAYGTAITPGAIFDACMLAVIPQHPVSAVSRETLAS
jgi:hypothetical protein